MKTADILALYDQQQRLGLEIPGAEVQRLPYVVRVLRPAPGMNYIAYSCVTAENADAVIAEQVAYLKPLGQRFEWKVFAHDTPADLVTRLAAHGFEPEGWEPLLVLDLEIAPAARLEHVTGVVRRVSRPEDVEVIIQV